jgi:chemotaxis protein histidine kinase CheA
VQALVLPVGADRYALELAAVREVVRAPDVTPLPGAPAAVLGVLNLRGEVVPLIDTATLLGIGRVDGVAFAAVAGTDHGLAALAADGEPTTVALGPPAGAAESPAGVARYTVGDALVVLLDLGELVAPDRLAAT